MGDGRWPWLEEVQEALSRRYAERTVDEKLPVRYVPDFRPKPGIQLETYGYLIAKGDLPSDPYAAAETMCDRVLQIEREVIDANPTADARVFLSRSRYPGVFLADPTFRLSPRPPSHALIKVRHDFAVRVKGDEPGVPAECVIDYERSNYPVLTSP